MAIARFVNTEEIVRIWNEVNPTNPIGKDKARSWRDEWLAQWKKANPNGKMPAQKVIPYIWLEEHFGEDVYRTKEKDALNDQVAAS